MLFERVNAVETPSLVDVAIGVGIGFVIWC
jgi:hypothetical protein